MGEVRLGVKGDGLVARVVADHVALSAVDAHVLVDQRHHLFCVVQLIVGSDVRQSLPYHILKKGGGGVGEEGEREGVKERERGRKREKGRERERISVLA